MASRLCLDQVIRQYSSRTLWQVQRFDRETGEEATITNAQGSAMRPVLSPDGKLIVYATRFDGQTGLRIRNFETERQEERGQLCVHSRQQVP